MNNDFFSIAHFENRALEIYMQFLSVYLFFEALPKFLTVLVPLLFTGCAASLNFTRIRAALTPATADARVRFRIMLFHGRMTLNVLFF